MWVWVCVCVMFVYFSSIKIVHCNLAFGRSFMHIKSYHTIISLPFKRFITVPNVKHNGSGNFVVQALTFKLKSVICRNPVTLFCIQF